jgi:hypothetical protein
LFRSAVVLVPSLNAEVRSVISRSQPITITMEHLKLPHWISKFDS